MGKRDRGWGRLVVQAPERPSRRLIAVAERAAAALAMHRLHDRHRDSTVRRVHHELLLGLLTDPTDPDVLRRCELTGLPVAKRQFVGLTLRPQVHDASLVESAVRTAYELKVPALVCEVESDVRILLSLTLSANANRIVDELAARVAKRNPMVAGAGRPATRPGEVDRTLKEAQHVVDSIRSGSRRVVHRLEDVHLGGLLTMLADDERLQMFVSRELGTLKEHDDRSGTALVEAVRALLNHPVSKSDAAASLHMSRPAFYDRIAKAERVLGANLDDPDIRGSIYVALLADEVTRER